MTLKRKNVFISSNHTFSNEIYDFFQTRIDCTENDKLLPVSCREIFISYLFYFISL